MGDPEPAAKAEGEDMDPWGRLRQSLGWGTSPQGCCSPGGLCASGLAGLPFC